MMIINGVERKAVGVRGTNMVGCATIVVGGDYGSWSVCDKEPIES
jgi:hypothetical protein